jgi:hypothetical protein
MAARAWRMKSGQLARGSTALQTLRYAERLAEKAEAMAAQIVLEPAVPQVQAPEPEPATAPEAAPPPAAPET